MTLQSVNKNGVPSNTADAAGIGQQIRWPAAFEPASATVFAHNEITIPASPTEVWAWLLRAYLWPSWYANSSDVQFLSPAGPDLQEQSLFRWKTFGLRVTCKVQEFEAPHRLAWEARRSGVTAWHTWLLTPLADGSTHVLTEEVQHGWLARLGKIFTPGRMQSQHQLWLEGLSRQAQMGMPPKAN